jgi:Sodium/hydrogen exchanger family
VSLSGEGSQEGAPSTGYHSESEQTKARSGSAPSTTVQNPEGRTHRRCCKGAAVVPANAPGCANWNHLTLIAPYPAYLAAESIDASGMLATVVCGLLLGYRQPGTSPGHRTIQASAIWFAVDLVLRGIVFILIGLQLPYVAEGIRNISPLGLVADTAVLCLLLTVLRLVWVFASNWAHMASDELLATKRCFLPAAKRSSSAGWACAGSSAWQLPYRFPKHSRVASHSRSAICWFSSASA